VKVEWVNDLNPFKDSSASIHFSSSKFWKISHFFSVPSECVLPPSFQFNSFKMVEEILIDDDPEYNWRGFFGSIF
jgi:hypothetical protein